MATLLLALIVGLPFAVAAATPILADRRPDDLPRISNYAALLLAVIVSLAVVDVEIPLLGGRALILLPVAQLGVQLMALAMVGMSMSLDDQAPDEAAGWLTVAWISLGGLTLALLVTSLTLAVLAFVAAGLAWAFGPPAADASSTTGPVLRYAALLTLTAPLLLAALRLAEMHTGATPELEPLILALAIPGFGLVLSLVPLHAWTVTLAAGSPRPMVIGVLGLVQTAGFILLLRTLARHPWMVQQAEIPMILGGALSALVGGWLALSSDKDDPDDWLAYAAIASGGMLLAGLGTQSRAAGDGVTLLLFARVLAIVVVALSPRGSARIGRAAGAAGALALAGTAGLAGFPGLWPILRALRQGGHAIAAASLLAGSGLLFATAVRRWPVAAPPWHRPGVPSRHGQLSVLALIAVLVLLGIAPQIAAAAFSHALRGLFFPRP